MTSFPVVGANNVIKCTLARRQQTTADTHMLQGPTEEGPNLGILAEFASRRICTP